MRQASFQYNNDSNKNITTIIMKITIIIIIIIIVIIIVITIIIVKWSLIKKALLYKIDS